MTYKVAALYQFVSLPDFRALKGPLERFCADLDLKGSLLLAHEGLNGTLAGHPEAIDAFVRECQHGTLFRGRLDNLELKFSTAAGMPFRRLKVRLKKEIVTLGHEAADPTRRVGTYVAAEDWNDLLETPDLVLIDTRNRFEVEMGTFQGATDPGIERFSDFREFVARKLDPRKHKKVAMFCTGGIRCEKASSFMLSQGFEEIYHLKGGILKYLETVPQSRSLWAGECFVFDERVALGHGLVERLDARERMPVSEIDDLRSRVDTLEMRFAYQDQVIEDLNRTITEQWKHIDGLTRRLANLGDRMQEAADGAGAATAPEPPPPHY